MNAPLQLPPNRLKLSAKTNAFILSLLVAMVLLIASLLFALHFHGAQLGFIGYTANFIFPGIVSSESFKQAILHPQRDDAYSAYSILADRHSDIAHQIALQQLDSPDDYLWLNAAEYLGVMGDRASIPYLIKALRHTAWRADDETKQSLIKLTGTDCGDFNGWQHWWLSSHPDSHINWESHLGFRPRLTPAPANS